MKERRSLTRMVLLAILAGMLFDNGRAGASDATLKNGMVVRGHGKPTTQPSFKTRPTPFGQRPRPEDPEDVKSNKLDPPVVKLIVTFDNEWQKHHVPMGQIPDGGLNLELDLTRSDYWFPIKRIRHGQTAAIGQAGLPVQVTPWDHHGVRRLTFMNHNKEVHVVQAISGLNPNYALITSLTHQWDQGVSLNSLSPPLIDSLLRMSIDPMSAQDRFRIVRFYLRAEMYQQAQDELSRIIEEFPERKDQATEVRKNLMVLRGNQVMTELQKRRKSGQHQLAEAVGRRFLQLPELNPEIKTQIEGFVAGYQQDRQFMQRAEFLLAEYQGELKSEERAREIAELRSELLANLSFDTLSALDPFLKSEQDPGLKPEEKLGLAYSGWVLGPAHAVSDLETAQKFWTVRQTLRDYLASDFPREQEDSLSEIRRIEGVSVKRIEQLIENLPPAEVDVELVPGRPLPFETSEYRGTRTRYQVVLPPEYHPHRSYPLLVALRPAELSLEQTLEYWSGTKDEPGMAQRRGYIVVTPQYLPDQHYEWKGDEQGIQAVVETLRDVRRRFRIDDDRIYLAGHGVGGTAAWQIGLSQASQFAGIVPICALANDYCRQNTARGFDLAWYFVVGQLDRDWLSRNQGPFDTMFTHGARCDIMVTQFKNRGYEWYSEELPRIFDWMELHRRKPLPREFKTPSQTMNSEDLYWLKSSGASKRVGFVEGRIGVGQPVMVRVTAPAGGITIRLNDQLVDPEKKVNIVVNTRQRFSDYLKPDVSSLLKDYHQHRDRKRLYPVVFEY